jgi:hypothetical protein
LTARTIGRAVTAAALDVEDNELEAVAAGIASMPAVG